MPSLEFLIEFFFPSTIVSLQLPDFKIQSYVARWNSLRASSHVVTQTPRPSIVSLRIKLSTAHALPCSHHSTVNEHVKFILFDDSQRQQFPFARRKKGSGERQCQVRFSIRNKCTKTTSNITTCSTAHFGVVFLASERVGRVAIVINELKFRAIKDISTQNMLFTLNGMKRNKWEIYVFLLYLSVCYVFVLSAVRSNRTSSRQLLFVPRVALAVLERWAENILWRRTFPRRRHEKILESHDRQLFLSCFHSFSAFSLATIWWRSFLLVTPARATTSNSIRTIIPI